jgi:hypothetical protein
MERVANFPDFRLSPDATNEALEYIDAFDIADCARAGWEALSYENHILRMSVMAITDALEEQVDPRHAIQATVIKAGAGVTYFAFGLHPQPLPNVSPYVLADEIPKLHDAGHVLSFESSVWQDASLTKLLKQIEVRDPVFATEPRAPMVIGAGCVRYLLEKQHIREIISSN